MQNKHQKKFVVGVPTSGEGGGGKAGWDKIPSLSKEIFLGLPLGYPWAAKRGRRLVLKLFKVTTTLPCVC